VGELIKVFRGAVKAASEGIASGSIPQLRLAVPRREPIRGQIMVDFRGGWRVGNVLHEPDGGCQSTLPRKGQAPIREVHRSLARGQCRQWSGWWPLWITWMRLCSFRLFFLLSSRRSVANHLTRPVVLALGLSPQALCHATAHGTWRMAISQILEPHWHARTASRRHLNDPGKVLTLYSSPFSVTVCTLYRSRP
jgi:hypothetical protein